MSNLSMIYMLPTLCKDFWNSACGSRKLEIFNKTDIRATVALKILSLYISHPVSQKELLEQVGILSFYAYIPIKIPKQN